MRFNPTVALAIAVFSLFATCLAVASVQSPGSWTTLLVLLPVQFTAIVLARSAAVVRLGKAAFYRQIERPLDSAYETTGETMAKNLSLEDASEGIDAFLGKRPPQFHGR